MGKRAQQKRSSKQLKRARQRTAAASRYAATFAQPVEGLWMPGSDDFGFAPSPWDDFTDRYPTVADELAAAEEAGGTLSCFAFDDCGAEFGRGLRYDTDGWRYEVVLYPPGTLRELVKTSWLDAEDRNLAADQLRRALAAHVPEDLRQADIECVQRPSTTGVPRIGWAQSLPVNGMRTWEDVGRAEKDLPLFDLAAIADGEGGWGQLPEETFALFRAHGLSARQCAGCGSPVTDRHPHWPGILVSVEHEYGPLCDRTRLGDRAAQPVGHVLDPSQARDATRLTGKESKVKCLHCGMKVTTEHPDWPGVWAATGPYSTPVCAVVGSGGDDDLGYDLIDCVYPHIPAGVDSPASNAVAAAKGIGYFLQLNRPGPLDAWAADLLRAGRSPA